MKRIILFSLLFSISFLAQAQQKKYKFGAIAQNYLQMKQYPLDTSADAVILCDVGEWRTAEGSTRWITILDLHRQIKILKKTAFEEYAEVLVPYYSKNGTESIRDVKAMVTHASGNQETVDKKHIFYDKLDKEYSVLKITFKGLQEGDVVEYAYTKESGNIQFVGPWYFQESIPVVHSEITFTAAERLAYQFVYSGYLTPKKETPGDGSVRLSIDSIPALKINEVYITTPRDYCAAVSFQLIKFVDYNGEDRAALDTWQNVAKMLEDDFDFGKVYSTKRLFSDTWKACKPLLETAQSEKEKVEIVYNFVNDKVKWNKEFEMSSEKSLDEVFKKGKGSSAEINLMMVALLREANVKASPMLISTQKNGKVIELYPFVNQFNHVLCYIQIGDKKMVLDGGNEYRPAGMPSVASLVKRGWIVDEINARWEDIPSNTNSQTVTYSNFSLSEEGELQGDITFSFQNYAAVTVREYSNEAESNSALKKKITSYYPDIQIDSIVTKNINDLKSAVKKVVYCKIPNAAIVSGDLIYLKPIAFSDFDKNPFKSAERNFPVDMPYTIKEQVVLNLTIPKGFEVETMPKSSIANLLETAGKSQYLSENKNNEKISINSTIQLSRSSFLPNEYTPLRSFYSSIATKLEEQIVLKKKK